QLETGARGRATRRPFEGTRADRRRRKITRQDRIARATGETVQLTDRINRIQISPTSAVIAEADKLKAKGVDIADFGPGEPDFPTPDNIKLEGIRAIETTSTKNTPPP